MKFGKIRTLAGAVAVAGLVAGVAATVQAAATTGNATATIIIPIAIANTTDLAFGSVVSSGSADTVIVSPAGARTCGGTLTCTNTVTAGAFDVTGGTGETYTISLPASATVTSGGDTMTVDTFVSTPTPTGTLTGGAETLLVGATLQVSASQANGSYTGTYSVTVNYQ